MALADWLKLIHPNVRLRTEAAERLDAALSAGGLGAVWGSITGTLSNQADLQTALDGKSAVGHAHAQSDVTGLTAALAGKSDTGHSHSNATTSAAGFISATDKTKLDGIANGATANDTDANLKNRANHTGTQAAASISDFAEAVDDRVSALLVAGTNITLSYNDGSNTLTINASGGGSGLTNAQVLARGLRA